MSENSIQGNGNWYYTDGQWISDEGADLGVADAFASGNPPAGYIPDSVSFGESSTGNPFAGGGESSTGNPFAGGNPFMVGGGGNVSTTSEDGLYNYNYTRTEDERSLVPDDNNPFAKLIDVLGIDSNSLEMGSNPFASTSDNTDMSSNPFAGGNNLPENLPIGSTPPDSTNETVLPEAPEGLSVPYNSDNWISDLKDLESGEPGASTGGNTGNGNGNWFYGSGNTANGNGNWYFDSDNTSSGNGNWYFGSDNTSNGNGNWYFGSNNTSDGNGNWQIGDDNTINGNGNQPSGTDNTINGNGNQPSGNGNNILGNANTSNISDGSFLGNNIEASDDGKAYIGNEDWSFDILDQLTSLGSGVSGVGSDVKSFLSHPDMISTTTSKEGFSDSSFFINSDYQFDLGGL
ncbi:hypothetical protein IQ243_21880 [Nostocales cyanobacterium LEGE 11386]|nr:hypothetical protein [Nostocales cyanobacterium LEGE 11386]